MTKPHQAIDDVFRNDPVRIVKETTAAIERRLSTATEGLFLYGAGHFGRVAADALAHCGIVPKAFIDRDPTKEGSECSGIPIIGLDTVHSDQVGKSLVVVTVYNCVAVLADLRRRGIDAITYAQLAAVLGGPLTPYCGIQNPAVLWEHESAVRAAMALWADEKSRLEYFAQLRWSHDLDPMSLPTPGSPRDTYFEPSLVRFGSDEVFIDCGAFDGDSVSAFKQRCPHYKALVALEPDPRNRAHFVRRFGGEAAMHAESISVLPYAVSDRHETVMFDVTGTAGSAMAASGLQVEAAPLDDIVAEMKPTFIKMDIEGAEPKALAGTANIMRYLKPQLAVCLYHDRRHLWQIPLQIAQAQPEYRLHLRRYADECWELICYAIANP